MPDGEFLGQGLGHEEHARAAISSMKPASAQKTTRHVACVMMKCRGPGRGAKPTIAWLDFTRASVLPCATSTRIARATEE